MSEHSILDTLETVAKLISVRLKKADEAEGRINKEVDGYRIAAALMVVQCRHRVEGTGGYERESNLPWTV